MARRSGGAYERCRRIDDDLSSPSPQIPFDKTLVSGPFGTGAYLHRLRLDGNIEVRDPIFCLRPPPPSAPVVYVLGPSVETLVAGDPWAEPSVWVVLGLLLLCCFLCLLCLLFWLCCGRPGKEKLYVYQVPDLPMKQVEVAFRA